MQTKTVSTTIKLDGKDIILETGLLAVQAAGAVTARCGDTIVLATVASGADKSDLGYFPLQVEYRDKHYAGGVISSSRFVKRESRPSDDEILAARVIDRSIRPLFPKKDFYTDIQVVVTPLSIDHQNEPEMLGALAASAALAISHLPWRGPLAILRVGLDTKGNYIANPTEEQKQDLKLDLIVAGKGDTVTMVEANANEASEAEILAALDYAASHVNTVTNAINQLVDQVGKTKLEVSETKADPELVKLVESKADVPALVKSLGWDQEDALIEGLLAENPDLDKGQISDIVLGLINKYVRKQIFEKQTRPDGRKFDEIRTIKSQVGLLPRTHGSAFFQRGLTHALSVVTLDGPGKKQLIEGMKGEQTKRYIHHYNMPGYASGETGRFGFPGRREIGHGALAERALLPMIPSEEDFPYTIRVVSEIMSSNGSTSQASVCGSTLSLMDAGVPIKKPVAGIAMGLITQGDDFITLSDIAGIEDHAGDMDFKVAGTADGITIIQMDVKVDGIAVKVLKQALEQARVGRLHILSEMLKTLDKPRTSLSKYAPAIISVIIDPEKIGDIIGPGGKIIHRLQDDYEVEIDINDSGLVSITGKDQDKAAKAKAEIEAIVAEAEPGKVYAGTVSRVESYGAFVEILPGKSGLIHVSRLSDGFLSDANSVVKVGDPLEVIVDEIDDQGRINLSPTTKFPSTETRPEGFGGGDRDRDRGRGSRFGSHSGGHSGTRSSGPRFYPAGSRDGRQGQRGGDRRDSRGPSRPRSPRPFSDHR